MNHCVCCKKILQTDFSKINNEIVLTQFYVCKAFKIFSLRRDEYSRFGLAMGRILASIFSKRNFRNENFKFGDIYPSFKINIRTASEIDSYYQIAARSFICTKSPIKYNVVSVCLKSAFWTYWQKLTEYRNKPILTWCDTKAAYFISTIIYFSWTLTKLIFDGTHYLP